MRLLYAIELIVAMAVGLALYRATEPWHLIEPRFESLPRWARFAVYVIDLGDPLCVGLVLVEGPAIWIEAVRRRKPFVWGIGRVTWSVCFLALMLTALKDLVWIAARELLPTDVPPTMGPILGPWWDLSVDSARHVVTRGTMPLCLTGLLATSFAARWPRDLSPDAREWAGRVFFGAVIVLYLTHETLGWYWE